MDGYKNGKPDITWWLRQIREGIQYRKKYAHEERWDTWRNYYRGNWRPGILPSNLYFKLVRSIVPRIYFRNPSVSILSNFPGTENLIFSQILERIDNKLIRNMKMKREFKRIAQHTFMFGTGVGNLGYGAQYTLTPDVLGETIAPNAKGARKQTRVEYNQHIIQQMPWFMACHPGNFIVPAGTVLGHDMRWQAKYVRRDLADLQADRRFKNTADLKGSQSTFHMENLQRNKHVSTDQVDMYEIRDLKTGLVFVIAPYMTDKVLLQEQDEFLSYGTTPNYPLVFNEDDEVFWGVPDSHIIEPLQREMNEIRTLQMKHRRMTLVKVFARINSIAPEQAAKIVEESVSPVIWTKDDPESSISVQQTGNIPTDLFTAEAAVMQDSRETLGFSRNEFGEYMEGSRKPTAYESRVVKAASDLRVDERRDMMADMLTDVITDMHRIIFNHWTQDEVIELVGPGGIPFWVKFRGSMLKRGQYEVNVDPDTSIPQTKDAREAKALQMYSILKENPLINPIKLTSYLLHEMHGVMFDDMMQGLPFGMGLTPQQPMNVGQYGQVLQNVARKAPQLIQRQGGQRDA